MQSQALSCQQGITADLPLAFNRCLNTGFSSAAPAAAEKSLPMAGFQLHIRQKRCGVYQSINLSFFHLLDEVHSLPNKMLCGVVRCCLQSQCVDSWMWGRFICFVRLMWVSTCHHCSCCLLSYLTNPRSFVTYSQWHVNDVDSGLEVCWYSKDPLIETQSTAEPHA